MGIEPTLPEELQDALSKGLLKRIPLTFLPFVNQQLNQWKYLFPNERQSVERLLLFVAGLSPDQSTDLFRNVVEVEDKMGVRHWHFSTNEQTMQNSSLLAASPYFQDWRQAVQAVYDAADASTFKTNGAAVQSERKLVLLDIPLDLPVDAETVWRRWQGIGHPIKLDLSQSDSSNTAFEVLLTGKPDNNGGRSAGLLDIVRSRHDSSPANNWIIDAGKGLVDSVLNSTPSITAPATATILGYARLDRYRENFSHEMNTIPKDLGGADEVLDHLRTVDVIPWCPAEVAAVPAIREFVRALYLSGNGAVIFGNSFVQWAASEAFRRARPFFLAAQFGVRSKPKPFTGVAIFDNPDQVNPLPTVDDLPGSALDAQMLALYVWLAAYRYQEYQHSSVCVCVAESLSQAYVVAPPEFALWKETEPVPLGRLGSALRAWMA
ncbi:MAG TPA: hypothetical protein VFC37_06105 [Terracidiphilus sp.]|nr:hypothetical protein [Terracidiphilus sp.]